MKKQLVLFFTLLFISAPAFAISIDLATIKEMDHVELMPAKQFKDETRLIERPSVEDKNLAFEVRMPTGFTETNAYSDLTGDGLVLGEKVLGVITRFVGPSHLQYARSVFTVEALQLTYEIGAKNWFLNHVLTNGHSLERMTVVNKKELEALYVQVKKDTTYIVRTKVSINGSKVVVASYFVPQEKFNDEKIMQAQVVKSFKLTEVDNSPIEDMKTFGFLNQSYFDYPPSWQLLSTTIRSIDKMKVQLRNNSLSNQQQGQVDIKVTNKLSTDSRSQVIKEFRKDFSVEGYKVGKFIEEPESSFHSDMKFGSMQAYELQPEKKNMIHYELWVSVMEGEDYYYLATLITPSRDEEFYLWARNVETYKLIVKTMRRNDKTKKLFDFMNVEQPEIKQQVQ